MTEVAVGGWSVEERRIEVEADVGVEVVVV